LWRCIIKGNLEEEFNDGSQTIVEKKLSIDYIHMVTNQLVHKPIFSNKI